MAAGIRRVKGAKKLGIRLGNWLTSDEARALWQLPSAETFKGKRDRALLAVLLGCSLRRRELAELMFNHLQRREDRWVIVDLVGKAGHVRTVPVPGWVEKLIDEWLSGRKSQRRQSAILLASMRSFFFFAAAMARNIRGCATFTWSAWGRK